MPTVSPATLSFLRSLVLDAPKPRVMMMRSRWRVRSTFIYSQSASESTISHENEASSDEKSTLEHFFHTVPTTHYDYFQKAIPQGPPPDGPFAIDLSRLKDEMRRLQGLMHPDRARPEQRRAAQVISSRINEAYKTLQSPLRRAEYLLELRGARSQADEEHVLGQAVGDEEVLMEVMEAREAAEEATGEEEIARLREENQQRIEVEVKELEDAFQKNNLTKAQKAAVRLSYWNGVEDRLREGTSIH